MSYTDEVEGRLPPQPTSAAGRIVNSFIIRTRGLGRDTVNRYAAQCSRASAGTAQRMAVLELLTRDNGLFGDAEEVDIEAALTAVTCWGMFVRKTRIVRGGGFASISTELGKLSPSSNVGNSARRSIHVLARTSALSVQREMLRAAQIVTESRRPFNAALLADDIRDILVSDTAAQARMRIAVESSSGRLHREPIRGENI